MKTKLLGGKALLPAIGIQLLPLARQLIMAVWRDDNDWVPNRATWESTKNGDFVGDTSLWISKTKF